MIYLDSSIALAHVLSESRQPPASFWERRLVASQLIEYEIWNRIHAYGLAGACGKAARTLLAGLELVGLAPDVLARALDPFPVQVRTLDALHLATIEFLRSHGQSVELASYDRRMLAAARALDVAVAEV